MRKTKTKTKLLAKLMMRKPKIVADIFAMGAESVGVPEIVANINECWELQRRWQVELTEHYVWSMFHRRAPFQNPAFYREVMEEHKVRVAGRLYSTTPSFTLSDEIGEGEREVMPDDQKKDLMTDLLTAGIQFQKAMKAIVASGLDPEAAGQWVDVTLDAMERTGVNI